MDETQKIHFIFRKWRGKEEHERKKCCFGGYQNLGIWAEQRGTWEREYEKGLWESTHLTNCN